MYYIYCIYSNEFPDTYIGLTKNIKQRMYCHKQRTKDKCDLKIYNFLNRIGWDNMKYKILENIETNEVIEARKRERFFIDLMKPTLNKCLPLRTRQEYWEDNKTEIKFKRNIANLSRRKEHNEHSLNYYYNNIEKIKQQRIEYRTRNAEKIKKDRAIIFNCGCGVSVTQGGKAKHLKSKTHAENLLKNILLMKSKLTYRKKNIDIRI